MSTIYPLAFLTLAAIYAPAQAEPSAGSVEINLPAGADGHFYGTVTINNHPMAFMIDSGATFTTIPMNLASEAGLVLGAQVETHTANGRGFAKTTRIPSLKLGSIEIKNLEAHANPHLQQVLIGLNILKYFTLQQTADHMMLTINPAMLQADKLDSGVAISFGQTSASELVPPSVKPSRPIVKSQVCKSGEDCIIRYGN